ncbi:hypothetical protein ACJX0J_029823, partial [Zea mays]
IFFRNYLGFNLLKSKNDQLNIISICISLGHFLAGEYFLIIGIHFSVGKKKKLLLFHVVFLFTIAMHFSTEDT